MFFVAKEKIGTTLGAQKEYAACERRGIRFHSEGNVWHYLWPIEMIEPSIRERFRAAPPQPQPVAQDEDLEHANVLGGDEANVLQFGAQTVEPEHVLWSQEVMPGSVVGEPVISAFSGSSPDWVGESRQKYAAEMQRRTAEQ